MTPTTGSGRAPRDAPRLALVHDYLTQRGGAERVALLLAQTFPEAALHTSLYEPSATFDGFRAVDVRPLPINHLGLLRHHHRLAFPVMAPAFSMLRLDADVVLCSSSGWAHGARTASPKVVYCHAPARWLYQTDRYLNRDAAAGTVAGRLKRASVGVIGPALRRWDRRQAASATRYLTNSTAMSEAIRAAYGIDAQVVPPPPTLDPSGPEAPHPGVDGGFFLCIARLLPYKNVDVVIEAFSGRPERLVVVGTGPDRRRLSGLAGHNVRFLGIVDDPVLRWLYRNCRALVTASYEDYGLTPLEAASFGRPSVVLRAGGFLDTVQDGKTGVFFDDPSPRSVAAGLDRLSAETWHPKTLTSHAGNFSPARFCDRIRQVVAEVAAG